MLAGIVKAGFYQVPALAGPQGSPRYFLFSEMSALHFLLFPGLNEFC